MPKLALLLALFSGCSLFIERLNRPLVEPTARSKVEDRATYCPIEQKTSFQLVGATREAQETYQSIAQKLDLGLDFLDHFALWSLLQLSLRPDQSSPTSRFQVLLNYGGDVHYFDFFSEGNVDQYPYFFGIEWVLRKFGKKTPLEYYARLLAPVVGRKLKVGGELAAFLLANQAAVKEDPQLFLHYFRGNEVLKDGESMPHLDFTSLVQEYRRVQKNQQVVVNTTLSPFAVSGGKGQCNYDFNLYDNSIFLIDKIIPVANLFGYADSRAAFLASSSQRTGKLTSLRGFPLFQGESKVRSSAVCMIENGENKIWTVSNESRDPGQHLFHLVRYGLARSNSTAEVDKLVRHSRHLFLSDPVRLVIESGRSQPDQVENLLKLNIPIYHAETLGNIWAYTKFGSDGRFIVDDRNPGAFLCK